MRQQQWTRAQWNEYLEVLARERICLSCWAMLLKPYLHRTIRATVLDDIDRTEYKTLLAISADCRCDLDDSSGESDCECC